MHFNKHNQHAFLKGHSTISALIEMTQKWFDETENAAHGRKGIHTILIDFSKVFDMVDHRDFLSMPSWSSPRLDHLSYAI